MPELHLSRDDLDLITFALRFRAGNTAVTEVSTDSLVLADRIDAALAEGLPTETPAQRYAKGLNAICNGRAHFKVEKTGTKYDKVVMLLSPQGGKSAHAFVEKSTGHVFKSVSWTNPAGDWRYESVDKALAVAAGSDHPEFGGYLYQ